MPLVAAAPRSAAVGACLYHILHLSAHRYLDGSSQAKNERVLYLDLCVVRVLGKCWRVVELKLYQLASLNYT